MDFKFFPSLAGEGQIGASFRSGNQGEGDFTLSLQEITSRNFLRPLSCQGRESVNFYLNPTACYCIHCNGTSTNDGKNTKRRSNTIIIVK